MTLRSKLLLAVMALGFLGVLAVVGIAWSLSDEIEAIWELKRQSREEGRECGARRGLEACIRDAAARLEGCRATREETCLRRALHFMLGATPGSKDAHAVCKRLVATAQP